MAVSFDHQAGKISISVASETVKQEVKVEVAPQVVAVKVEQLAGDLDTGMTFDQLKKLNEIEAGATRNRPDSESDDLYVAKEQGKQLSANDFTDEYKGKLEALEPVSISASKDNTLTEAEDGLYARPASWSALEW